LSNFDTIYCKSLNEDTNLSKCPFLWKMAKKDHYKAVKVLIETGNIVVFREIFNHVPRTTVANDLGIYYSKFKTYLEQVDRFSIRELYQLARLIGVEGRNIVQLAVEQIEKDKAAKVKKGK